MHHALTKRSVNQNIKFTISAQQKDLLVNYNVMFFANSKCSSGFYALFWRTNIEWIIRLLHSP
jgi:hypothetical protein